MKRYNLKFWGSYGMAGCSKAALRGSCGAASHPGASATERSHLHPVTSICFRYQQSGNLRIFLYPFVFNWAVLEYKRSPNPNWQWCMWLFKTTFPNTTIDYVASDLHKFLINLWTPQKCLSQALFKFWETKAIRQAMPVEWTLEENKRLKSCISALCTGILSFQSGCTCLWTGFLRFFPNQSNRENIWTKSRCVYSLGLILVCHCLRKKKSTNSTKPFPFHFLNITTLSLAYVRGK